MAANWAFKHGDEHSKQAMSDTTQGATVVVTDLLHRSKKLVAFVLVFERPERR
jgi:hypothetical protein